MSCYRVIERALLVIVYSGKNDQVMGQYEDLKVFVLEPIIANNYLTKRLIHILQNYWSNVYTALAPRKMSPLVYKSTAIDMRTKNDRYYI